ncbi:unnamed protein product [Protopolystoma xenopodis]|uniref:Uncharacterized protein n=1 Tax=Protopolystoma xenopodis TaxID=117903 RepID=A0A448XGS4_9PLAT|nr:unnamed protein product [Protopolystoma xenopodis]
MCIRELKSLDEGVRRSIPWFQLIGDRVYSLVIGACFFAFKFTLYEELSALSRQRIPFNGTNTQQLFSLSGVASLLPIAIPNSSGSGGDLGFNIVFASLITCLQLIFFSICARSCQRRDT